MKHHRLSDSGSEISGNDDIDGFSFVRLRIEGEAVGKFNSQ
jgi:hypothetical protein